MSSRLDSTHYLCARSRTVDSLVNKVKNRCQQKRLDQVRLDEHDVAEPRQKHTSPVRATFRAPSTHSERYTALLPSCHNPVYFYRSESIYRRIRCLAPEAITAETRIYAAPGPFVNVVYAPFKKEVCAQCFAYDRGRKMKHVERSTVGKEERGIAWFCSEDCHNAWKARLGEIGLEALSRVTVGLSKVQKGKLAATEGTDKTLTPSQVGSLWARAETTAFPKTMPLLHEDDDQDTFFFLLDGIMARHNDPSSWSAFLSLNPSLQPYESLTTLDSHIRMYQYLRYHLPEPLKRCCTAETVLALITRDHGNSFGIFEDELGRDGEMLGYGTWTSASFFNHSCQANVTKRRHGRQYVFVAKRDMKAGEELCINYIEDAVDENVDTRRRRLQAGWGFVCACSRCTQEV